jgi:hypothetical protein
MIRPVNFWGRCNCTSGTGLTEGDESERCSYPIFVVESLSNRLAIVSTDVNHPMALLRVVDSFSQVAIKAVGAGGI